MAARDALSSYEGISYVAQLTDTNRSGWLLVCGVVTLLYPLCFLALRVWVKYRRFGVDDWMCTGSTLLSIVQHAILFASIAAGLGHAEAVVSEAPYDWRSASKLFQAMQILFVLSYGLAKLTVATLVYKLFSAQMGSSKRVCEVLMGLCIVWFASALLVLFINCGPSIISSEDDVCNGEPTRWWIISVFDIVTEISIVALIAALVDRLQLTRKRKAVVILSFLPRIGLCIPAALHAANVQATGRATDVAFAHVNQALWLQTMLAWSLLTCSIPSFKAALRPFERGGGAYSTSTDRHYDEAAGNLFVGRSYKTTVSKGGKASSHRASQRIKIPASNRAAIRSSMTGERPQLSDQIQVDVDITVLHESEGTEVGSML